MGWGASGLRVEGLRFRVEGFWGSELRGLRFRVEGFGEAFWFGVWGLGDQETKGSGCFGDSKKGNSPQTGFGLLGFRGLGGAGRAGA